MKKSLSIVMPVHNVQSSIVAEVDRLLEIMADITTQFELMIIDNGSTDGTEEVLYDLTCRYPQVRSRRYTPKQGNATAIDLGLAAAAGEVVIIQDINRKLTSDDILSLWAMHVDATAAGQQQVIRPVAPPNYEHLLPEDPHPLSEDLLRRLSAWGADISELEQLPEALLPEMSNSQTRNDVVQPQAPRLKMPRFLKRLHDFATGE
ncbi:glycosyltransferase family 2 protein [Blastopirellula marina]|uniref:glycosyltransferase family 2 protein n=1 Tax=Blastopirellula marina TaxID=124 RepID=UPI001304A6FD|nr:glycosyltransferase [Blastopirellula marina]